MHIYPLAIKVLISLLSQREYAVVRMLEDYGFSRVRSTDNRLRDVMLNEKPNCCRDVLWINERKIPKLV